MEATDDARDEPNDATSAAGNIHAGGHQDSANDLEQSGRDYRDRVRGEGQNIGDTEDDGEAAAKQVVALIEEHIPDIRERLRRGEDQEALRDEIIGILEQKAPQLLRTVSITGVQSTRWQAPLPSPDVLDQFEQIVPGSATRIIAMTEHVLTASGKTLDKLADAEIVTKKRGQWQAYSLALASIGAAIYFFAAGNNVAGGFFLSLPVVLLIASFLSGGDIGRIFGGKTGGNDDEGHAGSDTASLKEPPGSARPSPR